ncbi:MAG: hypothetical protein M1829_004808 [Trizodia sp. TS-e1964]|nr:MAG: hypothetical protein M1829_004808 [Trizodia sp. TS-e1964]
MHWALPAFLALLPPQLVDRLPETYVDQEAMDRGENGNFILFDLSTGDVRWKVPPSKRIRVSRERLRKLLMEGVDVQWSKQLERFDVLPGDSGVTVYFEDGSSATGSMLLGCDGSRSRMRKLLCPNTYQNTQLPCRLLGVSVPYPAEKGLKMRALDPFFLQAGDPKTDSFLYFSFLDTPTNRRHPRDTFLCQILTSWPYRPGFLSSPEPIEVPDTNSARLALMKRISAEWVEPFHSIIADIPSDTEAKSINLEDWQPHAGAWDNHHGRVTLLGDAAHAMTMFRGEAANHGITDAASWLAALLPVLSSGGAWDGEALRAAVDSYEAEMVKRCGPAVLASRRACLDAHEHARIDETSPLVNKRAMVVD